MIGVVSSSHYPDDERISHAVTGLILSGLLKRFESSLGAFKKSIQRLIRQHKTFIEMLDDGHIVSTQFLRESASTDDEDFEELIDKHQDEIFDVKLYRSRELLEDVQNDLSKLNEMDKYIDKAALLKIKQNDQIFIGWFFKYTDELNLYSNKIYEISLINC